MEIKLIEKEFTELNIIFNSLKLSEDKRVIFGPLAFEIERYVDSFDVEIKIPDDYPSSLPTVYETSNRIPKLDLYHVNTNGALCLGSRRKISEIFFKEPCLLGFVKNAIIPFFYSFCYLVDNGIRPYGELSHGSLGILEDYKELLGLEGKKEVLDFLDYMLLHPFYQKPQRKFKIRTRDLCLCGSKLRFGKCHKKHNFLADYYSKQELEKDRDDISKL